MPKIPTYPVLYDECLQLSISFLKSRAYLTSETYKGGTVNWNSGEGEHKRVTGQIDIAVNTFSESPYIELSYKYNGTPINYRVQLVAMPSNLLKGVIWYFICPHTGKRCRKLYLVGGKFLHRTAFRGCMYEKQTRSKRWRLWDKIFTCEEAEKKIYSRYFKKYYNSKPTKRYSRLLKKTERRIKPFDLAYLLR